MSDDPNLLAPLRARIDAIDARIVDALAERVAVVREVVVVKHRYGIPARIDGRVAEVLAQVRGRAEAGTCPPDLVEQVWRAIVDWTIGFEERHMASASAPSQQD